MSKILSWFFHGLIRFSGLSWIIRMLFARNKVTIIAYHDPQPANFEAHVKYLLRYYNLISFQDYLDALFVKRMDLLPKYALIITLDDGWTGNFNLLPIVIKYKLRPTIFLTSQVINTERHFWWTVCSFEETKQLKGMTNEQRLNTLNEKYRYSPEKEYRGMRQALSSSEIETMKNHFDFGLHTCSHPVLINCSYEEKRSEILECKTEVERILGRRVETFSYPNGDYDRECIEILKECGIKAARTIDAGWNDLFSDPLKLKITGVSDDGSITKLASELTGISLYLQHLMDGNFRGSKIDKSKQHNFVKDSR
jgi:peptidoglycan/xylan/chitin deacetylase (PgdA/CDA1 family)